MDLKLSLGQYVPSEHAGLETLSGQEELIQRVLMKLQAPRGAFPPLPDYGSRLYLLHREKPSHRNTAALLFAAEALEEEDSVTVESAEVSLSENGQLLVALRLTAAGEATAIELEV
ncbi:MAG: hypothetical protein Q4A39_01960 [Eubacteriales bacterium]|nr:hypothetical protein [Eubacteriales bacterium]